MIKLLTPIMNKASIGDGVLIQDVFKKIFETFQQISSEKKLNPDLEQAIIDNMAIMHEYQLKMNECWNSLRSPMEVKSILGLIPEYSYINRILDNQKYDNPSLNYSLYESDQKNLDYLKQVIVIMRKKLIDDITALIGELNKIDLLTDNESQRYSQRCQEINAKIENELENMGLDPIRQSRQFGLAVRIVGAPFIIIGQLGIGVRDLGITIGSVFSSKEKEKQRAFKLKVI